MIRPESNDPGTTSRRALLAGAAGASLLGAVARGDELPAIEKAARKGRIKQSLVQWCYAPHFDMPTMIKVAKGLGCTSIELGPPKDFPMLKEAGLTCAIGSIDMGGDPPFVHGFNNPAVHNRVIKATTDAIDACAAHGFTRVICFTGYAHGIPADVGALNCIAGFKKCPRPHAEPQGRDAHAP